MLIDRVVCAPEAEARLRGFAAAAYPDEGCGVLIGRMERDGTALIVDVTSGRNMRTDRARDRYDLDPSDLLRADRDARARGLDVVGIWHTHPDHPARPSAFDTERAWMDYAYLICSSRSGGTGDLNAFVLQQEGGPFAQVALERAKEQAARP
jgi:proteasome lid subunit RPN8/RPN11